MVRHAWTFGDGGTVSSAGALATHAYRAAGSYSVALTVTDDVGHTSRVSMTATTTPRPPTASARVTCSGRTCTFDGSASRDDIGVDSYTWDFLDNSLQTGARVTKSYTTAGAKQFRLTVRNTSGLIATLQGRFTLP